VKPSRTERGYSITDVLVGLLLLALVILSIYQLYVPTFTLSQNLHEGLEAQQDVRLGLDRVSRALRETTTAFGRVRLYAPEAGCTGAFEGCIGFVTARDACTGSFRLVGGAPDWQATIYVWRDTASNELRLRCDADSTFPVGAWPPTTLEPHTVIGTRVVAASFTLQPAESPAPTAIAVALQEQASSRSTSRYHTSAFNRTVFLPRNR
jgi:hypothetical protein